MSYGLSKRIFDLGFSIVVLTCLLPVFLVLWIVFRFTYPRVPFLFGVPAMGLRGKKIRLWKISTMVKNAHLMLEDILRENPAMKEEWERDYKLKNDPRILPGLGRILRKTSVNEFPQFWNVLCGELSVVGPRPISRAEELKHVEIVGEEFLEWRHSIRPGITGLWQISGRNNVSYEERIDYDRRYLMEKSFWMDFKIILITPWRMIIGKGAY